MRKEICRVGISIRAEWKSSSKTSCIFRNCDGIITMQSHPFWEPFLQRFHTSDEPVSSRRKHRLGFIMYSWVAVFGLFSLHPTCAIASCGDYLSHGEYRSQTGLMDPNQYDGGYPGTQIPKRSPCQGLFCHQSPAQHPLSTPVVPIEPQDRWGGISAIAVTAPDRVPFLARRDEFVALPMMTFRLDRPPKNCRLLSGLYEATLCPAR